MTDLLPCPFCGGILFTLSSDDRQVKCVLCNACGPEPSMVQAENGASLYAATQHAAIDLWNQRALPLTEPFLPVADMSQIEAGSITIGDKNGLHMIIDGQGQRIYDGDRLVHNA